MKTSMSITTIVLLLLSTVSMGWSQDAAGDGAAIRERIEMYVAAYNRQDAAAVADLWSEDGVYVNRDTGQRVQGRSAISAMFQTLFQTGEATHLTVNVEAIRLITADVAIEDGTAEVVSPNGQASQGNYTAVHVKKDGVWFLDSVRETNVPPPPPEEPNPLDQLAWMVGEWLDQNEDATVRSNWIWSENKRFLTNNFSVSNQDQIELKGTQIIGWDAAAGNIRSWVFDSEGGFGEGIWRRAGNQWTVEFKSTQNDGSQGSAVNVYTFVDDQTFKWKSVDRQVDGESLPDIEEVTIIRQ